MSNEVSDETLMQAVRAGQLAPLGILFERYHTALFEFFRRLAFDRQISEDLVQDVFCRILRYRHTFRDACRFRPWMYGIARNAHGDHRARVHADAVLIQASEEIADRSMESSPYHEFQRTSRSAVLQNALMQMPADRRELLVLYECQELTAEEIGELLGIEAGAVRVRVHRAMKELRHIFFELSGNYRPCDAKPSEITFRTT